MLQTKTFSHNSTAALLPVPVNFSDLRNLLRLLKKKPEGVSVVEVTDFALRRLFDPCKLLVYEKWGITNTHNNFISLGNAGWELAKCSESEARIYRKILRQFPPYHDVLKKLSEERKIIVTYTEIVAFWKENYPNFLVERNEKSQENLVITFFNLCHFAELGMATLGRKGQPTRLSIDLGELRNHLENQVELSPGAAVKKRQNGHNSSKTGIFTNNFISKNPTKIYLSFNEESEIILSIQTLLEFADVEFETVIRSKSETLLSEKNVRVLRNCSAAIIVADEQSQMLGGGSYRLRDSLLSEIVAAYAMFEGRVLLFWIGSSVPKINLNGLKISNIKSNNLSLETGLEVGRVIKEFKNLLTVGI